MFSILEYSLMVFSILALNIPPLPNETELFSVAFPSLLFFVVRVINELNFCRQLPKVLSKMYMLIVYNPVTFNYWDDNNALIKCTRNSALLSNAKY